MRRALILWLLLCGWAAPLQAVMLERSVVVDGRTRSYRLFVPAGIVPDRRLLPLVLAFHGGGGDGRGMERLTHFSDIAQRERFLVAYPEGVRRHWNDGRPLEAAGVDDVAFVRALIDDVATFQPLDAQRIYATGMSNGGIFTHYLATKLGDRLAAVAPVAGGITEELAENFRPVRPTLPVLIVHGTEDRIVPYRGGAVLRTRGRVVADARAVDLWREAAGLGGAGEVEQLPDADPGDGCRLVRTRWREGTREVQWLQAEGGGHTWPGGAAYLPPRLIGRTCRDLDASEAIWAFFAAHSLPR